VAAMFVNGSVQNEQTYGRFCIKFPQSRMKGERHRLSVEPLVIFFLTILAKGNMSFCHHLVSFVCHPFTFHISIFSSEIFLEINQSETRIACGGHV
jgi:hypothetical protein